MKGIERRSSCIVDQQSHFGIQKWFNVQGIIKAKVQAQWKQCAISRKMFYDTPLNYGLFPELQPEMLKFIDLSVLF